MVVQFAGTWRARRGERPQLAVQPLACLFAGLLMAGAAPVNAEMVLFSQRNFQGARYGLTEKSPHMQFSPRSVRVAGDAWEVCPRPFFGGTCLTIRANNQKLNLPRGFSGVVRSARPLGEGTPDAKVEPKDAPPVSPPPNAEPKPDPKVEPEPGPQD